MSELAVALVEAQKAMPAVPKNATADTGKFSYSYVTLDSLISKTLPVLNEHGIAITQAPEYIEGFGIGLRTTLTHTGGETVSSVMPIIHAGHSMQDLGGAITYARRYAWASVLGIASEHDDDAGAITHTNGQTATAQPNPQAQTFVEPTHNPVRDVVNGNLASDKQKAMIRALAKKLGLEPGNLDNLSKRDASARITELKALEEMGAAATATGGGVVDDIPFERTFA